MVEPPTKRQKTTATGKTINPKPKTHHPVHAWFVTINPNSKLALAAPTPPDYDEDLLNYMAVVGHTGDESGLEHYHCVLQFREKKSMADVKAFLRCGWAMCQTLKSKEGSQKYLSDGHTTTIPLKEFGEWHHGTYRSDIEYAVHCAKKGRDIQYACQHRPSLYRIYKSLSIIWLHNSPKAIFDVVLEKDWQHDIVKICDSPADWRTIYFVYNASGNEGKTQLTKWLQNHYSVCILRPSKAADCLYLYNNQPIVIFDIPKSTDDQYVPWGALEQIKDGIVFSSKYDTKTKYRTTPCHIFVFSNHPPPVGKYSEDRIKLITI